MLQRDLGYPGTDQEAPPSFVTATTGWTPEALVVEGPNPTATHERAVGHETAESPVTAVGTGLEIQDCPPSLVVRMP
jgi:hypothetical protein